MFLTALLEENSVANCEGYRSSTAMQTTLTGEQNMANVEGVPSPNWSTYDLPTRTLDEARTPESSAAGKLNSGTSEAASTRMKPPADLQIRGRTPAQEIAERLVQ